MLLELLACGLVGLIVYHFAPWWEWPTVLRVFGAILAGVVAFLLYCSRLHRRTGQVPDPSEIADESPPTNATLPLSAWEATHQVPQRFSLALMAYATLLFAALSVCLTALRSPPLVSLCVIGFVAVISAMQIFLQRVPRMASMVAGALVGAVLPIAIYVASWSRVPSVGEILLMMAIWSFVGIPLGYISGVLIAGAFLVADAFIDWWTTISSRGPTSV